MIIRSFKQCHSCGSPATRVARYSSYRKEKATERFHCSGCGLVFEQDRLKPVKLEVGKGR